MTIERSTTWKNRVGTDVFTIDADDGIRDMVNNGLVSVYRTIEVDLAVGSIDKFVHTVMAGVWVVAGAVEAHTVVGGAAAAVTVVVCPGSGAIAAGVPQLSAVLDLTVAAPAKAFGALIATPTEMYRGDSLAVDLSGTLTGLVGCLTIMLKRIK